MVTMLYKAKGANQLGATEPKLQWHRTASFNRLPLEMGWGSTTTYNARHSMCWYLSRMQAHTAAAYTEHSKTCSKDQVTAPENTNAGKELVMLRKVLKWSPKSEVDSHSNALRATKSNQTTTPGSAVWFMKT